MKFKEEINPQEAGLLRYRFAGPEDAKLLGSMNWQLIRDEGHRNSMTIEQLAERMAGWLRSEYRAVLFEDDDAVVGYALFRREPDYVYLRQFFVRPEYRRKGIGRDSLRWLWANAWRDAPRLRIDVLTGNGTGHAFWQAVGFRDYCITMEMEHPHEP